MLVNNNNLQGAGEVGRSMTTRSVGSVGKFVDRHFPERQIYHRSRGSVQFITLTARAQIGLLVLTFAFLGWVAYASVNAVFKDQIIRARERHFSTIQAAYEGRLAEMQAAYDELNGALVLTQERFTKATSELESRHRQLAEILIRQEAAARTLGAVRERVTTSYAQLDVGTDSNRLILRTTDIEPTEARGGERIGGPLGELVSRDRPRPSWERDTTRGMPRPLADDTRRIQLRMTNIDAAQRRMAAEIERNVEIMVGQIEDIIHVTGLSPDKVVERVAADAEAQGGPYIPLAPRFKRETSPWGDGHADAITRLALIVDRLTGLDQALKALPLVLPVQGEVHVSSGFGRRRDPFTGRPAFHYGLDFREAYRAPVFATSAGIVTVAGRSGPYGNLVEIDHGHGIKTRYGHLHTILVKPGERVAFQQKIGLVGSTGRSTGPHLHYEVRFNGTLRDPARFLEAGRYVFQG